MKEKTDEKCPKCGTLLDKQWWGGCWEYICSKCGWLKEIPENKKGEGENGNGTVEQNQQ